LQININNSNKLEPKYIEYFKNLFLSIYKQSKISKRIKYIKLQINQKPNIFQHIKQNFKKSLKLILYFSLFTSKIKKKTVY
jgi:hypothetical protein